jgi:hypothetical protein
MQSKWDSLLLAVSIVTIALLILGAVPVFAQNQDPIIGTWNFHSPGSNPFIFVQSFNAGGTTVEFDTPGTNSNGAESIVLGKWSKAATGKYTFKEENYVYENNNLSLLAVASCKVELSSNNKHASGPCTVSFYACSVSQCPGALEFGPSPYKIEGKRF